MKLPFDDPRYQIPGVPNSFNLSQWTRENEPQQEHKFAIGDVVVLTVVREITAINRDCDGTPLYSIEGFGHGWSENNIRKATEEEEKNS